MPTDQESGNIKRAGPFPNHLPGEPRSATITCPVGFCEALRASSELLSETPPLLRGWASILVPGRQWLRMDPIPLHSHGPPAATAGRTKQVVFPLQARGSGLIKPFPSLLPNLAEDKVVPGAKVIPQFYAIFLSTKVGTCGCGSNEEPIDGSICRHLSHQDMDIDSEGNPGREKHSRAVTEGSLFASSHRLRV